MNTASLRRWAWIHKWSSLVCTIFMLLLCLTGLPLIFHHEIGHLLGTEVEAPEMAADTPRVSLDKVMEVAIARHPDLGGMFVSQEADDDRLWFVTLSPTPTSESGFKQVAVDARTGEVLAEPKLDQGFMYIMFSLHVDLFAGLAGKLFLGFMGILLVIAIVSGVVLYGPFMKKLKFGTVRDQRSSRLKWLDLHNLLGIVTLSWALVVGVTGVINTWADLLVKYWQYDQMSEMVAPYKGQAPLTALGSLQKAVDAAIALEPDMKMGFIAFPGTAFTSPHHYGIFMRGTEPLTSRLFKPVLVDAKTGEVTDSRVLPWYLTALLVSQPLHFGDYGGMPMKIIWTLLDLMTIVVLGSGLYLWIVRRKTNEARMEKLIQAHQA
ncbi:PepSY-associated TM helix domain-containing protein [Herminiimonas fonticola]|uniref:Putative iron-regulated membrane protein n=1 Tax=Herminiimonas fonticola TaxID=303380 RepID=A0A4R6G553_9BURK|nr:PepSY domain-containing protein [Herminiimonas fonticola]RBA23035.1 putative iron-regulated membrane protein [Herminiimonas fonticola]TDN89523.1 putative iron-regulated membrane protein [Herminiimonas fonticola]